MTKRVEGCPVQKQRLERKSRIGQDPLHDETAFGDEQPASAQQVGIAEMSKCSSRVSPGSVTGITSIGAERASTRR